MAITMSVENTPQKMERRVQDEQLVRMEKKIDEMAEAMLLLVRMDERMVAQAEIIKVLNDEVVALRRELSSAKELLHELQIEHARSLGRSNVFERVVWVLVSSALGIIGWIGHAMMGDG
jgi:hypothetical protein